jgi:hypothetical protein
MFYSVKESIETRKRNATLQKEAKGHMEEEMAEAQRQLIEQSVRAEVDRKSRTKKSRIATPGRSEPGTPRGTRLGRFGI